MTGHSEYSYLYRWDIGGLYSPPPQVVQRLRDAPSAATEVGPYPRMLEPYTWRIDVDEILRGFRCLDLAPFTFFLRHDDWLKR